MKSYTNYFSGRLTHMGQIQRWVIMRRKKGKCKVNEMCIRIYCTGVIREIRERRLKIIVTKKNMLRNVQLTNKV